MSINIYFEAAREIIVKKTGKTDIQTIDRECWQTPTNVTYKIHNSQDPVKAYCDWVLSQSEDETVDVFDDDENFIGRKVINFGKEHVNEFLEWVDEMKRNGYDVRTAVL